MVRNATLLEPLHVASTAGKLTVAVPWKDADAVQAHLRRHGVGSTLFLDAAAREARLELWPDVSAETAQAILDLWGS